MSQNTFKINSSSMIFGKERNKVFKQIKQDNHAQKDLGSQQLEDKH
jgi:hypothetical protein